MLQVNPATTRSRSSFSSLATAAACLLAAACELGPKKITPISDPIADAISATAPNTVGLFSFRDRLVVRNRTAPLKDCDIVLDGTLTAQSVTLPLDETVTIMATRFRPYVEPDVFYRHATKEKRMTCTGPLGRQSVTFSNQAEQTVFIPKR